MPQNQGERKGILFMPFFSPAGINPKLDHIGFFCLPSWTD